MKLDSHVHFWNYDHNEFSWIGENMSALKKNFLPSDISKNLQSFDFDGIIAVQARQKAEETKWLLELASKYLFIKGVVGWVDLCSPEIEKQLDEFTSYSKLVGVRHVVHDEPDDAFMARHDFQYGISLLSKYGLTYDLLLFPKHLPLAAQLVSHFPNQKFVLDHIAKPFIKNQLQEPWSQDIAKLAKNPNVYCKLSGMVTEADWDNWNPNDFKYYFDWVFSCFDQNRIMIGSDWPVCTVAGSYNRVISLVIDYLKKFDEEIQNKILGENCRRFYLDKLI